MKNIYRFIVLTVLVVSFFGSSVAQERIDHNALDKLRIDGSAVAAETVEGVLLAISQKYRVRIALVSDRTDLPSSEGVVKVGRHLAYFPDKPKINVKSGFLQSVLKELLPPRYDWKFESDVLVVTPKAKVSSELEGFLSTSVVVPEIGGCGTCAIGKTIRIDDPVDGSNSLVSDILSVGIGDEDSRTPEPQSVLTIHAFLIELLKKGRFKYVSVGRLKSKGRYSFYLTLEE